MSLTVHIIKKDFRRLLGPLVLWALLLLAQILIGVRLLHGDGDNLEWFGRMALYGKLFFALDLVVTYVLVAMLIHEDPLVGSQEFWLTRPISGARLLGAKILGAVVMFGVLPMLIWLPWWLASGYGWHEVATAVLETLIWKSLVVIPALVLAVVTDHFSRYLVWTLVLILVLTVVVAIVEASLEALDPRLVNVRGWQLGIVETKLWLVLAAVIATAAAVVLQQFLTRNTTRSFVSAAVGLLLAVLLAVGWSWDWTTWHVGHDGTSAGADQISITLDQAKLKQKRPNESPFNPAGATFYLTAHGVPADLGALTYWAPTNYRSEQILRWPDGAMLRFRGLLWFDSFEAWEDGAMRRLLGVRALQTDTKANELGIAEQQKLQQGRRLVALWPMSSEAAARLAKEPPAYDGWLNFLLIRPKVEFELPLRESGREWHGTNSLRLAAAGVREDGRMFASLIETMADPRIDVTGFANWLAGETFNPKVYALKNRAGNEATFVLTYGSNQATRIGTVQIRWNTLAFSTPREKRDGKWVSEPATWFDGATLVRAGFVPDTLVSRELKIERLEFTP